MNVNGPRVRGSEGWEKPEHKPGSWVTLLLVTGTLGNACRATLPNIPSTPEEAKKNHGPLGVTLPLFPRGHLLSDFV